jgi:hypothetical protein
MSATKPQPPITNAPQPHAPRYYRGKLVRPMTLGEIALYCRQMAWELDADAATALSPQAVAHSSARNPARRLSFSRGLDLLKCVDLLLDGVSRQ